MKFALFLVILLAWFTAAAPVRAELWCCDSLEWMTDDSELIVRAKVVKSVAVNFAGAGGFHDITMHINEVLKGKVPGMTLVIRSWEGEAKKGRDCLLFLKQGDAVYGPKDYRRPVVEGHWTQRTFWNGSPYGAIDLKSPGDGCGIVTADFKVLKKGEQILSAVRARLAFTKKNPPVIKPAANDPKTAFALPPLGVVRLDAPSDSPAFKAFYGGSAVLVFVPADKMLRPKLVQMLKQDRHTEMVSALSNYPGPETEKLLRDYLNDPTISETTFGGKIIEIHYPVRAAAYGALLRLGVEVPPPVLSKKPGQ